MKKEFYRFNADAKSAAEAFAKENNGYVRDAVADYKRMSGAWCSDDAPESWDGEICTFEVEDNDFNTIGISGYWE